MDKEKTPANQEKAVFFEKVKKIPYGDVLVSIFDSYTFNEEIQTETTINNKKTKEMKAIAPISSSDSAVIELCHLVNPELDLLTLSVFRKMDDCLNENPSEIRIIISASRKGNEPDAEIADFIGKKKNFNLKNDHDNLLLDIIAEAHQSLKIVTAKNQ